MQTYALLDALRRLGLLSPEQLAEAARLAASSPSSQALCDELVRRDWLTAFQTAELLGGRGHGLLFGNYFLLDRLGAGGMGEVFRARHQTMGREVALKRVLPGRLDAADAVARFLREVRATSILAHPNVVQLLDAGEVGGVPFMAMELVRGVNLSEYLGRRGPLPVAEAVEYVRQACLGMQHAHEKGLVHRDLKPGNLMLSQQRVVKIMDLGLALVANASTMTQGGASFGTVDYMAPEQVIDSHKVDIRADVYSLGCTLYHLLAGKTPFDETHPAARPSMHVSQEPPPLEQRRPDVPPRVTAVVRTMMAKRREHRYATPGEAAAVLASLLAEPLPRTVPQALPAIPVRHATPAPPPRPAGEQLPEVVEVAKAETRPSSRRLRPDTVPDRPSRSGRSGPDSGRHRDEERRPPDGRDEEAVRSAATWLTRLGIVGAIHLGVHLVLTLVALASVAFDQTDGTIGSVALVCMNGIFGMLLSCSGLSGFLAARSLNRRESSGWVKTSGVLAIVGGVIASLIVLFGGCLGGLLLAAVLMPTREPTPAGMLTMALGLVIPASIDLAFLITAFIAGAKAMSVSGLPARRSFDR